MKRVSTRSWRFLNLAKEAAEIITAGIDIGSVATKAVVLSEQTILGSKVRFTGYSAGSAGKLVLDDLLADLGLSVSTVDRIVATGYGRNRVPFADRTMTEIICHGTGAYFQNPRIRTIIDIGGQDCKAIALDDTGKVKDFVMNDKCAAGTGRFLEVMARVLGTDLDNFAELSLESAAPAPISSTCAVFAESEVVSLIAKGAMREDIVAGIHESIASRVSAMVRRIGIREPVMMTGGGARNRGLIRALESKLGVAIEVSDTAQVNGALGAAVLGMEKLR